MPDKRGFFAVYKRGQGSWSRIILTVVLGIFLIWFLVTLDGSFSREVTLIEGSFTVLDSEKGTLNLTSEDLDALEEYAVYGLPAVTVRILKRGEERPLEEIEAEPARSVKDLRERLAEGGSVFLAEDVIIDRPVTEREVELFRRHKSLDEKIDVVIAGEGAETVRLNWAAIERDLSEGKRVSLKGEVSRRTWWYGRLFTVPVVDVDINNGHILVIGFFLLGALGIFWFSNRPRNADFLIETEGELKKVDWSTKEEVFGSTKVVIFISIVFLVLMFLLDTVYAAVLRAIRNIFGV